MICDRVRILNFRNIEEADVVFSEGVNVLWGDNAQGKTNLLEAIRLTGSGKSFRAVKESELIRFGCEMATVSLDYRDKKRVQNLTARIFTDARRRQVEHNGVRLTRLSDMVGAFDTVLSGAFGTHQGRSGAPSEFSGRGALCHASGLPRFPAALQPQSEGAQPADKGCGGRSCGAEGF